MSPRAGLDGRKTSPPPGFFFLVSKECLLFINTFTLVQPVSVTNLNKHKFHPKRLKMIITV